MPWRCKKHKEECKSYVQGIVREFNKAYPNGNKFYEENSQLVEFVRE